MNRKRGGSRENQKKRKRKRKKKEHSRIPIMIVFMKWHSKTDGLPLGMVSARN
jgi:hypothetical protein